LSSGVRAVHVELRLGHANDEQAPEDNQVRFHRAADRDAERHRSTRDLELVAERGRPPRVCGASAHVHAKVEAVVQVRRRRCRRSRVTRRRRIAGRQLVTRRRIVSGRRLLLITGWRRLIRGWRRLIRRRRRLVPRWRLVVTGRRLLGRRSALGVGGRSDAEHAGREERLDGPGRAHGPIVDGADHMKRIQTRVGPSDAGSGCCRRHVPVARGKR
jgi:hypothetical protein